MQLKSLELSGFKSFAKKTTLHFESPITAIVGPNGSGKSNVAEAFRFALGEQSIKSLRGKKGEDLIFNGSRTSPRANRAGVKVFFDNRQKLFNVDFDEASIERIVHRDGVNEYLLNGSRVRLKDIVELLAGGNIGASGHHIISQGEADRILSAPIKERREMIEDALGLKIFQYKREESLRKLEKTRENVAQVESLRREIAPHLRFLEKQVEKVAKTAELRDSLRDFYKEYLKREDDYLTAEEKRIASGKKAPAEELARLDRELLAAKELLAKSKGSDAKSGHVIAGEERLADSRKEREKIARELGRLEGEISGLERRLLKEKAAVRNSSEAHIPLSDVKDVVVRVAEILDRGEREENAMTLRGLLEEALAALRSFVSRKETEGGKRLLEDEAELQRLAEEKKEQEKRLLTAEDEHKKIEGDYRALREEIESAKEEGRDAEREVFRIMARQSEARAQLGVFLNEEEKTRLERAEFKRELTEAGILVGKEALSYRDTPLAGLPEETRGGQFERRRQLEKMKIKLEEFGAGGGEEILREHKEVKERDDFLGREINDLEGGVESLEVLIAELEEEIDTRFKDGILKINGEFQKFFSLMFGGGKAELVVIARARRKKKDELSAALSEEIPGEGEEEEREEGIDIIVSLPHKRIKGLELLSGGERALTSIALIFAMSQVNPPPFLVLDETDAALDEANSRRYGDMIENLAEKSQLILITHNRETMSRAGVLYGVTMGGDGVSKLLSVKFDEAAAVAK